MDDAMHTIGMGGRAKELVSGRGRCYGWVHGRESGGTGRRTRFRISRATVGVRVPPLARAPRSAAPMDAPRVTLEDLTPIRKRLRVEVPADPGQAELDRAFQRLGGKARLRGFRPRKGSGAGPGARVRRRRPP